MDDVAGVIDSYLRSESGSGTITLLGSSEGAWDLLVPSYWKETLAVSLALGDWTLRAEAFFMRAPEDNAERAYRLLLQRNGRGGPWRFSANEAGDVSLLASIPRAAVSEEELDRVLGALVTISDETYVPYMKLAFERGLAEQVARGGPGLDQPPPWAREGPSVPGPGGSKKG